jgi:hypothetical protein
MAELSLSVQGTLSALESALALPALPVGRQRSIR